jgi:hypothetical protein
MQGQQIALNISRPHCRDSTKAFDEPSTLFHNIIQRLRSAITLSDPSKIRRAIRADMGKRIRRCGENGV